MSGLSYFNFFSGKEKNSIQINFPDIVNSLLIWGMAVICWTQVSMPHSYFSPGPYPPNNEMYPFSDAARYDTAAQYALIGEGLGTNDYVDKPLYVAFLTFIHLIVGSRMESVVALQVAFIALVPVLIYLIGRKIHNRMSGLLAAGFFVFREINNIQGTLWILSTNSRVLMSESLVTLLLILFVFMFTGWVKNPRNRLPLIAAGGALGLAGLVRLNPLLLMPVAFIAIWLVCWKQWKRGLINSLVFSLMFLATIFPWMLQSYFTHGNFLYFKSTMNGVVLDQRTYYSLNKPAITQAPLDQTPP
jgi:4-amino-4-deoxy-L-arabinose transferase-like glycosyltransferase